MAALSISAFHRHFKAVTTLSPLQYQKRIRLLHARSPLIAGEGNTSIDSVVVAPEELEFYYPVGPKLAMLHIPHTLADDGATIEVGGAAVDYYNRMTVAASPDYFFADSRQALALYIPGSDGATG